MALNLVKLAVGIEDVDQLAARQARWRNVRGNTRHRTRMMPTRGAEICPGGSMYWVIRGMIQVRQPIVALHRKTDKDAKSYCVIELAMQHVVVEPVARRPFQGWRYLRDEDAPRDMGEVGTAYIDPKMPKALRLELRRLGLL
ncbi:MAG: DUF1489 family protein [Rhodospirillaceae bacterium]|nr:MAG: DUF1489 family protein [Rhodospirillaceae bacterium]